MTFSLQTEQLHGPVAQWLASPTTDPVVVSSIRFNTLVEIEHEIICTVILLLPLIQERLLSATREKYVPKVLVNHLVKLACQ